MRLIKLMNAHNQVLDNFEQYYTRNISANKGCYKHEGSSFLFSILSHKFRIVSFFSNGMLTFDLYLQKKDGRDVTDEYLEVFCFEMNGENAFSFRDGSAKNIDIGTLLKKLFDGLGQYIMEYRFDPKPPRNFI